MKGDDWRAEYRALLPEAMQEFISQLRAPPEPLPGDPDMCYTHEMWMHSVYEVTRRHHESWDRHNRPEMIAAAVACTRRLISMLHSQHALVPVCDCNRCRAYYTEHAE